MTPEPAHATTTRRTALAVALGASGALGASTIVGVSPAAAAANGNVQLAAGVSDSDNDSAAETRVRGTTDGITALSAVQAGSGTGLYGYTLTGTGVRAVGGSTGDGLAASSSGGTGAIGASYTGSGVHGHAGSTAAPAIAGPAAGVVASAGDTSHLALRVLGRAAFEFSGKATIAAHHASISVARPGVSAASLIIATLQTDRAGVVVQSAVPRAGGFTIHLNRKVPAATVVGYMIIG